MRYGSVASLPWGRERFERGSLSTDGDVLLNWQHSRSAPLARTGGGGLVLSDDGSELTMRAELPPTTDADNVLHLVRSNVLRGLSVEFHAMSERIEGGVRVVTRAALSGIAVVDKAAYPDSVVEAQRARIEAARFGERGRFRIWL